MDYIYGKLGYLNIVYNVMYTVCFFFIFIDRDDSSAHLIQLHTVCCISYIQHIQGSYFFPKKLTVWRRCIISCHGVHYVWQFSPCMCTQNQFSSLRCVFHCKRYCGRPTPTIPSACSRHNSQMCTVNLWQQITLFFYLNRLQFILSG
jgi:hypothetical protein